MVHIVCCVITMSRIISMCAQHFYCTSYKQCNQSHSDYNKILVQNLFWSYFDQFSTVFDGRGTEIDGNMCGSVVQHRFPRRTSCNRFKLVFHRSYDIFENWATGNQTEKDRSIN